MGKIECHNKGHKRALIALAEREIKGHKRAGRGLNQGFDVAERALSFPLKAGRRRLSACILCIVKIK
jgi:hypothetical protein